MCDYSLQDIASRPAKVGDELVATKFAGTATRGFSAIGEPNVAVCLLPGTEIALEREAEYRVPVARLFAGFENETGRAKFFCSALFRAPACPWQGGSFPADRSRRTASAS